MCAYKKYDFNNSFIDINLHKLIANKDYLYQLDNFDNCIIKLINADFDFYKRYEKLLETSK